MKIEVDINKKYFVLLVVFGLLIVGIVGVVAYGTDVPVNFGHSVMEINWDEAITKNITAAGFCIGDSAHCVTNWEDIEGTVMEGGESLWENQTGGSPNIYFNSGYVGIGIANPSQKLHIVGNLKVDGMIKGDASGNVVIQLG